MKRVVITLIFLLICAFSFAHDDCNLSIDSGFPAITNSTCGENNGSIHIRATGDGTVRYSLNGGTFTENGLFENLPSGTYNIVIEDSQCQIEFNTTLSTESEIIVNSINTEDSACNDDTGSITIDADGTGLLFQLDNLPPQNQNTFTNLAEGNYTVTIIDAFGCEKVEPVTINSGIVIESVNTVNSICGENEGSITVNATSTSTLEYRLVNVRDWQTSNVFDNLDIGTYSLEIRDQNGCFRSRNVAINQILGFNRTVNHAQCGQNNGSISILVTTPGNYDFSFDGGAFEPTSNWSNLAPGTYAIIIRDINGGCERNVNTTINEETDAELNSVDVNDTPCMQNSGRILASATGTNLRFDLLMDGTVIDQNSSGLFENLPTGNYQLILVSLVNGAECPENPVNVSVGEVNDIIINSIDVEQSDCSSDTGTATILAESNLNESLSFSVDGSTPQSSNFFSNLSPGTHTVEIFSDSGCSLANTFFIEEENNISINSINTTSPSNACSDDGSISVTASGSNLEFSIDNGETWLQSNTFNNLFQGSYIISIRDGVNCQKQSGIIELTTSFIISNILTTESVCEQANGRAIIQATGAEALYSIDNENFQESNIFENLLPGNYTAYVESNDCLLEQEFTIENIGNIAIQEIITTAARCGESNGVAEIVANTDEELLYSIDGENFEDNSLFSDLVPGTYTAFIQSSPSSCVDSLEFEITGTSDVTFTTEVTPTICGDFSGQITVNASGEAPFTYSIDGGPAQNDNVFNNLDLGNYAITVRGNFGCETTDTISVFRNCLDAFPSAIMPNGNGKNEYYRLLYFEPLTVDTYQIFDRWGNLVYKQSNFSSTEIEKFWNGDDNEPGTYTSYVVYTIDGEKKELISSFQLVR